MFEELLAQEQMLQEEKLNILESIEENGPTLDAETRLEEIDEELEQVQLSLSEYDEFKNYEREYDAI